MALRRLLLVLAACAALAAAVSGRASAAGAPPDCSAPPALPQELDSPHFKVFYVGDANDPAYLTETQAGDLAGKAEAVYQTATGMGYPAPVGVTMGADGQIGTGIYFMDLEPWKLASIICDGWFIFDAKEAQKPVSADEVGADVFEESSFDLYVPTTPADWWLSQGASEWGAAKAQGYDPSSVADLGPPDMSLDCYDATGTQKCSPAGWENLGQSRWPFYEYLAERFGDTFMREAWTDAQADGSAYQGLVDAIAAHGSSFTDVFNAWAALEVTGAYGITALQGRAPIVYGTPVSAGVHAGTVATVHVPVDHLAARILEIDRGDGTTTGPCYAATLTMSVSIPSGTSAKPMFYWSVPGGTPLALTVNGATGTATVPWDTCTWSGPKGYLVLPNASHDLNSADFVVTLSMTVDTNTPATPFSTPGLATTNTSVTPVSSTEVCPAIDLLGPDTILVAQDDAQLRLAVQANAQGLLQVTLGPYSLGTAILRAGDNDVRLGLSPAQLAKIGGAGASGLALTLTPLSPSSIVRGAPASGRVALDGPESSLTAKKTHAAKAKHAAAKKKHAVRRKHAAKKKHPAQKKHAARK